MGCYVRVAAACALATTATSGRADVYTYVGSDNVVVLSNSRPQNRAAEVLVAEPVPTARAPASANRSRFDGAIDSAARMFGLDGALLHAIIAEESAYDARARSPRGAAGLMQLMPETARNFGAADVFDPVQNINGGARYLKYLLEKYDYQLDIVLAAYNAGEKALLKYGKKVPPFKETLRYIEQVQARYARYRSAAEGAPAGAPAFRD